MKMDDPVSGLIRLSERAGALTGKSRNIYRYLFSLLGKKSKSRSKFSVDKMAFCINNKFKIKSVT